MKKPLLIAAGCALLLVLAIVIKESAAPEGGPGMRGGFAATAVEVAVVKPQMIAVRAEAVGTAYARESVLLTANVTDTVESIHFEDGQRVRRGEVLVVLSHNEEEAELRAAQVNLAEQE